MLGGRRRRPEPRSVRSGVSGNARTRQLLLAQPGPNGTRRGLSFRRTVRAGRPGRPARHRAPRGRAVRRHRLRWRRRPVCQQHALPERIRQGDSQLHRALRGRFRHRPSRLSGRRSAVLRLRPRRRSRPGRRLRRPHGRREDLGKPRRRHVLRRGIDDHRLSRHRPRFGNVGRRLGQRRGHRFHDARGLQKEHARRRRDAALHGRSPHDRARQDRRGASGLGRLGRRRRPGLRNGQLGRERLPVREQAVQRRHAIGRSALRSRARGSRFGGGATRPRSGIRRFGRDPSDRRPGHVPTPQVRG